jgi:cell division protein FtsZ
VELLLQALAQALIVGLALLLVARILVSFLPWPLRRAPSRQLSQRIRVVGVGGGGGNALDSMTRARTRGVDFIAFNTDTQALRRSKAGKKVRIGAAITHGLGTGGDPDVGRKAADEDAPRIAKAIAGSQMVFVTAGLGGGTGSGAAPVIASIARDQGALTIGVVTKPFEFEGTRRRTVADAAAIELLGTVDTLITIPNDRVRETMPESTSLIDAFEVVDGVLRQAVHGVIDIIAVPGLINLDFADVRIVLKDGGAGVIGVGQAGGQERAVEATRQAVAATLLQDAFQGATGILLNVTGSGDLRLAEVVSAAEAVRAASNPDANLIFGANFDPRLGDEVRVSVIATGFSDQRGGQASVVRRSEAGGGASRRSATAPAPPETARPSSARSSAQRAPDAAEDVADAPSAPAQE